MFRRSENLTRRRLLSCNYKFKETLKYTPPKWAQNASWDLPNVDIANKYGISRERVRVYRKRLGHPLIEARGRRKNEKRKSS
jgi:uncharacterized protein YjcR